LGCELIEVASLELGDQIEAQYLPIAGIFYDHKDDLVGVTLEGLDHMIRHPQSIYVEESGDGVAAIAVIDGDGTNHLRKAEAAACAARSRPMNSYLQQPRGRS
jgi:hypothetical protein